MLNIKVANDLNLFLGVSHTFYKLGMFIDIGCGCT